MIKKVRRELLCRLVDGVKLAYYLGYANDSPINALK